MSAKKIPVVLCLEVHSCSVCESALHKRDWRREAPFLCSTYLLLSIFSHHDWLTMRRSALVENSRRAFGPVQALQQFIGMNGNRVCRAGWNNACIW